MSIYSQQTSLSSQKLIAQQFLVITLKDSNLKFWLIPYSDHCLFRWVKNHQSICFISLNFLLPVFLEKWSCGIFQELEVLVPHCNPHEFCDFHVVFLSVSLLICTVSYSLMVMGFVCCCTVLSHKHSCYFVSVEGSSVAEVILPKL